MLYSNRILFRAFILLIIQVTFNYKSHTLNVCYFYTYKIFNYSYLQFDDTILELCMFPNTFTFKHLCFFFLRIQAFLIESIYVLSWGQSNSFCFIYFLKKMFDYCEYALIIVRRQRHMFDKIFF